MALLQAIHNWRIFAKHYGCVYEPLRQTLPDFRQTRRMLARSIRLQSAEAHGPSRLASIEAQRAAANFLFAQTFAAPLDYNSGSLAMVGDFCTTITPRRGLTTAEREKMLALRRQLKEGMRRLRERLRICDRTLRSDIPATANYSDEAEAEWSKAYEAMREREGIKSWETKAEELEQSLGKYLIKPAREGTFNPLATTRGYVWLFVRK